MDNELKRIPVKQKVESIGHDRLTKAVEAFIKAPTDNQEIFHTAAEEFGRAIKGAMIDGNITADDAHKLMCEVFDEKYPNAEPKFSTLSREPL